MPVPDPVMTAPDIQQFLRDGFPDAPPPFVVDAVTSDGVVLSLPYRTGTLRPGGTISGPTLMALADTVGYAATVSRIGPVALAVTSSLSINFLRKPGPAELVGTGRLLKVGRKLVVTDVLLESGPERDLVAQATVTYARPSS